MIGWSGLCDVLCLCLLLQDGRTPLMEASLKGHLECVKALLELSAIVNHKANVSSTKAVK